MFFFPFSLYFPKKFWFCSFPFFFNCYVAPLFQVFSCDKAPLYLAVSVGRSVGRVTHSFHDPHVAPIGLLGLVFQSGRVASIIVMVIVTQRVYSWCLARDVCSGSMASSSSDQRKQMVSSRSLLKQGIDHSL